MKYMPYAISHAIRRLIAITLVLSFLIISPTIILYTAGYRYDWKNRRILTTGTISIHTLTKDIEVLINNEPIVQTKSMKLGLQTNDSIRLTNIAPGKTYTVTIKKPGYHTFTHDILVHSNQTSFIKNISLIKVAEPEKVLSRKLTNKKVSFSKDGKHLVYATKEKNKEGLQLLNLRTKKEQTLYAATSTIPQTSWSPYAQYLGVFFEEKTVVIDAENPHLITNTSTTTKTPKHAWKNTARHPALYIEKDNGVFEINKKRTQKIYTNTNASPWYIDGKKDFWETDHLTRKNILKKNSQDQVIEKYAFTQPVETIVDINEHRIIVRTTDGILVKRRNLGTEAREQKLLETTHLYYNEATNEWLTWNEWELWAIYDNGTTTLLNRMSKPVTDIKSLDKYGMLLFVTKDALFMFNPGYYITTPILLEVSNITDVAVNQEYRKIYFFATIKDTTGVYEIEY